MVPSSDVNREVLWIKAILCDLNRDFPFLDDLLLLHRFLSIYLPHLVIHFLTDPEAVGSKLHFPSLQKIQKHKLHLAGLEIGVDGDISYELKLVQAIVQIRRCVRGKEELYPDLANFSWNAFLEEERRATDESVFLQSSIDVLEFQT